MIGYVVRRVVYSIPVVFAASVVVFFGISSIGDPLAQLRRSPNVSEATIASIVEAKHLDEPLFLQYGYWVRDAVTNAFGTTTFGQPIWPDLSNAALNTLQLVVAAELIALLIAVPIGVISARRQYSALDYGLTGLSFLGYSIPVFWFALILQVIFTNLYLESGVRILYTSGLSSIDPGTGLAFFIDRLQHLALPVAAVAYVNVAAYSRYMRSEMLEVLSAQYLQTARAKGVPEKAVMRRHALRNALIPITTVVGLNIGLTFGGSIVAETVFSLDGMGLFFIEALNERDVYSVMAFFMITAVLVLLGNLLADLTYGYLDPRSRT
ncbi:oligopeptide ABC transporter permease AppB [Georgenia halophila]|uniref:Oligopeptide ABC transporter permease AppB n=1 Tax=Georgenia halophila TaxID=620889 RepID=A0ABP8LJG6_9MICO